MKEVSRSSGHDVKILRGGWIVLALNAHSYKDLVVIGTDTMIAYDIKFNYFRDTPNRRKNVGLLLFLYNIIHLLEHDTEKQELARSGIGVESYGGTKCIS